MNKIVVQHNTAGRMVEKAARLFKQHYGQWPTRIGLDYFTRMIEFAKQYGYWYTTIEPVGPLPEQPEQILFERVGIEVVPAIFEQVSCDPRTGRFQRPTRGRNEVLCERDDIRVFMTIWWTEQGEHAIIWD